jgi:hypothetical protein
MRIVVIAFLAICGTQAQAELFGPAIPRAPTLQPHGAVPGPAPVGAICQSTAGTCRLNALAQPGTTCWCPMQGGGTAIGTVI